MSIGEEEERKRLGNRIAAVALIPITVSQCTAGTAVAEHARDHHPAFEPLAETVKTGSPGGQDFSYLAGERILSMQHPVRARYEGLDFHLRSESYEWKCVGGCAASVARRPGNKGFKVDFALPWDVPRCGDDNPDADFDRSASITKVRAGRV